MLASRTLGINGVGQNSTLRVFRKISLYCDSYGTDAKISLLACQ